VLPTQEVIDRLADRIERAYSLRRTAWWRGCSTRRVWSEAALRLWQVHMEDPQLPLDSELYVASQPISAPLADPWTELAQPEAGRRYRSQVRRIVRRLRFELSREVRLAERMIRKGRDLESALQASNSRLSPLGCYIAAQRLGRADLVVNFAVAAADQHRSCPLYRTASLALIAAELYPTSSPAAAFEAESVIRTPKKSMILDYTCKQFNN
jgi:hypothetical protein